MFCAMREITKCVTEGGTSDKMFNSGKEYIRLCQMQECNVDEPFCVKAPYIACFECRRSQIQSLERLVEKLEKHLVI